MFSLYKIKSFILDIFFPSFCVGCKKEGDFLCKNCQKSIEIFNTPFHPGKEFKIKKIYCPTRYRQKIVKELIHKLKYNKIQEIKNNIFEILLPYLIKMNFNKNNDYIIIPVPLHKKRLRDRGFNQSELIALKLAETFNLKIDAENLIKIKDSKNQAKQKSKQERIKNIKKSFSLKNPKNIHNKNIILVDDVITTGATLKECAKILKKNKAKDIIAVVIAK